MGTTSRNSFITLLGMAFFSTALVAADPSALDNAYQNLDEIQSKLSEAQDAEIRNLAPLLQDSLEILSERGDIQLGFGRPHHPGHGHGPVRPPHGPGPRPRGGFVCVAVDRGYEEHRGGHLGYGREERWASYDAMKNCERFHRQCRIHRCDRR